MDIAQLLVPKQETMTPPRDEAARLVSLPSLTSEARPPRRRVTLVRSKQQAPSPAQQHPMVGRVRKPISRPKRRVILMRTPQQQHRGEVGEPCSPPKRRVIFVRGQGTAAAVATMAAASTRNHAKTEVPIKLAAAAEWLKVSEGKAACTESAAAVVSAGRANPRNAEEVESQLSVTTRSGRISRPPARFVP